MTSLLSPAIAAVAYIGPGAGPPMPWLLRMVAAGCMIAFVAFVFLRKRRDF